MDSCPLGIISEHKVKGGKTIEVTKDLCAGCRICWAQCPTDAVCVSKFIEGSVSIRSDACPEGCHKCMDVCPVDAMGIDEDGKVFVRDMYCIYCGACLPVCPSEGAVSIGRTSVKHTPVESGAWNNGLEKVTSAEGLARELAALRTYKSREATDKLMKERNGIKFE